MKVWDHRRKLDSLLVFQGLIFLWHNFIKLTPQDCGSPQTPLNWGWGRGLSSPGQRYKLKSWGQRVPQTSGEFFSFCIDDNWLLRRHRKSVWNNHSFYQSPKKQVPILTLGKGTNNSSHTNNHNTFFALSVTKVSNNLTFESHNWLMAPKHLGG